MRTRDVVVVGASAGGVESLRVLVAGLPADLPATLLVVLHVSSTGSEALARILELAGPLPARAAVDGEPLPRSTIVVAEPDRHLLVAEDHLVLAAGPRENGHRPAIDALFRSAARSVGNRAVGVVLSGTLDDGAAGLVALRAQGGLGVVQDPDDALFPEMPANALAAGPEHVLPLAQLPGLLDRLTREVVPAPDPAAPGTEGPVDEDPDRVSEFSCPDCAGVLWRVQDPGLLRFRCRLGHGWTGDSLLHEQSNAVEGALSVALRSLEERLALHRELSRRASASGRVLTASRFQDSAEEVLDASRVIRELLAGKAQLRRGSGRGRGVDQ